MTRAAVERLVQKYRAKAGTGQAPQDMEARATMEDILTAPQLVTLRKGSPERKTPAHCVVGSREDR